MKILKFPDDVIKVAENYLEYYECDEENDEIVNKLPDESKDELYNLYTEMEEALSRYPVDRHESIRADYK